MSTESIADRSQVTVDLDPIHHADFALDGDQQALLDVFGAFFERECPPQRVRDAEPDGFDAALWKQLAEMRVVAMGVPTDLGGDGAALGDLVLVTEQWGRHLAPVPLAETVVAARLLARLAAGAADGPAATWLDRAIDGSQLVTLALHPASDGRPQLVPAAAIADATLTLVGDDVVVSPASPAPRRVPNQGHTPLAWFDPSAAAGQVLASGPVARRAYESARRDWRLLMAGALTGMADGALAIAVGHAKDRIAFGVPIGSFQAVAHPLVDVAMNTEVARRMTRKAAWWADVGANREAEDAEGAHLVPMAYRFAEEAAVHATTVGVHTLGGVGFTVESDMQLYFRRAKGWSLLGGAPDECLDAVADELFGPTADDHGSLA